MKHSNDRRRKRRGIFMTDTMIGFAITAVLALVLVTAVTKSRRAETRLDDGSAAWRIAQRAMADLQQGKMPNKTEEAEIKVTVAPGGAKTPGQTWTNVTVTYRGRTATLIGLVPTKRGTP